MNTQLFKVTFVGVKPLLMHSPQMANPLNPITKELKKYSSKRTKTDDDHLAMSKLEFIGGSYYDKEVGYYIPSENVEACIVAGAKVSKNGKKVPLAVNIREFRIPLIHRGGMDKTPEELFEDSEFVDVRFVNVSRAKIMRTRPRFDQWSIVFHVELDTSLMDFEEFLEALNNAGQRACLGDARPRYGSFEVRVEEITE